MSSITESEYCRILCPLRIKDSDSNAECLRKYKQADCMRCKNKNRSNIMQKGLFLCEKYNQIYVAREDCDICEEKCLIKGDHEDHALKTQKDVSLSDFGIGVIVDIKKTQLPPIKKPLLIQKKLF